MDYTEQLIIISEQSSTIPAQNFIRTVNQNNLIAIKLSLDSIDLQMFYDNYTPLNSLADYRNYSFKFTCAPEFSIERIQKE